MTKEEVKNELNLKQKCKQLETKVALLKEESLISARIINQLKLLSASSLKPCLNYKNINHCSKLKSKFVCGAGHFICKIVYARFNFVNRMADQETEPQKKKNIDLLQSKYGFPSIHSRSLLLHLTQYLSNLSFQCVSIQPGKWFLATDIFL